jgi:hypothetical protein
MTQFNFPPKLVFCFTGVFCLCWLPLQISYSFGKHESIKHSAEHAMRAIETRVAQDVHKLSLPNPTYNKSGNPKVLEEYIASLNGFLEENNWPVTVTAIARVNSLADAESRWIRGLEEEAIYTRIDFAPKSSHFSDYFSFHPIWASLLLIFLLKEKLVAHVQGQLTQQVVSEQKAWMVVDLKRKILTNAISGKSIEVPNKPLCFFCALVDHSLTHPELTINPNKQLPDTILNLANKYFFRLIDLGHTIRRRPDFNNNLEKVLSEIRSALDELFVDDRRKALFYPPKALGEGSRSKLHNVALTKLQPTDIEFIGR